MQWQEFEQTFPIQLNTQQKEAVQSVDGPVLLLAVPGSGKTTVLVTRLGYMVYCRGIPPENILTVTYTVAATGDMSRRCAAYFGENLARRLEFRTINGICARILQYYGKCTGKTPFELATDEKVTAEILSEIYRRVQREYPTESDLKNVRTLITYIKNMMLDQEQIRQLDEEAGFAISEMYREYCARLRERHLMDYDDQMVYAYQMLRRIPGLLAYFQEKYPYICVDEAQDTSKIQHAIIALLASKTENLFMVGDEDQSIYGFRAAYPEALLSFGAQHPGAKVLLMEDNFRSNAHIVRAADRFIQKNTLRHEKHMRPTREETTEIREIALKSRRAQYAYLAKVALNSTVQTAVLYRDNECAIPLIDLLERNAIPYRMRNAELTFFTHRTVLDIINVIKLAADPEDTEAFLQVYYKIGTYLRKQDAVRIAEISREQGLPVLDVAAQYSGLNAHTVGSVKAVRTHLKNMLQESGDKAVNRIVQFMGYREYLERSGMNDSKIEILKTIGSREDSPVRLVQRLEELKAIIRDKEAAPECKFTLSTIHASKGLEYDTVYLMDVVDGILPETVPKNLKAASREELEIYEEERRLFYVGATRAKSQLFLFTMNKQASFCSELLGRPIRPGRTLSAHPEVSHGAPLGVPSGGRMSGTNYYLTGGSNASEEKYRKLSAQLGAGLLVVHKKFGEGVVVDMDENNVKIRFGDIERILNIRTVAGSGLLKVRK